MVKLIYRGARKAYVKLQAQNLADNLEKGIKKFKLKKKAEVISIRPGFISKVNKKYIYNVILRFKTNDLEMRNKILKLVPQSWLIDVDPIDLL